MHDESYSCGRARLALQGDIGYLSVDYDIDRLRSYSVKDIAMQMFNSILCPSYGLQDEKIFL